MQCDDIEFECVPTPLEWEKKLEEIYEEKGFLKAVSYIDSLLQLGGTRKVEDGLYCLYTAGWSHDEQLLHEVTWSMFGQRHYAAYTPGGGYYYTEQPYGDIEIHIKEEG